MNTNTVAAYIGGTGVGQIKSQTLASVTETEFVLNTGASPATAIAVLAVPLSSDIRGVATPFDPSLNTAQPARAGGRNNSPFFNANQLDLAGTGGPFLVRICGLATPASNAGNSLNIILYNGTTKSGTAIASTGAVPQATTTTAVAFIVEAEVIWDSTSQTLDGQFWFAMKGTSGTRYTTWAQLSNPGSSITAAKLQFVASATWGNAAGGVVAVSEMSITRL